MMGYKYPFIQKLVRAKAPVVRQQNSHRWQPFRRNIVIRDCLATMRRIGTEIVREKKGELESLKAGDKEQLLDKDILSALIRANMRETGSASLDDEEVVAQIATFLVAGMSYTLALELYKALYRSKGASQVRKRRQQCSHGHSTHFRNFNMSRPNFVKR